MILRLSNFAHDGFLTLGAYITFLLNTLSVILTTLSTDAEMLLSEKLLWLPMRSIRVN